MDRRNSFAFLVYQVWQDYYKRHDMLAGFVGGTSFVFQKMCKRNLSEREWVTMCVQ